MECPNCGSTEVWDRKCHSCGHIVIKEDDDE